MGSTVQNGTGRGRNYTHAKLSLFSGVCEPDRDTTARVVPPTNHPSMKALNSLLSGGSRFESVGRIRLAIPYNRLIIPDKGDGSRRMTEASLEESTTHDLVRCHQSCQGLAEHHISSNDISEA